MRTFYQSFIVLCAVLLFFTSLPIHQTFARVQTPDYFIKTIQLEVHENRKVVDVEVYVSGDFETLPVETTFNKKSNKLTIDLYNLYRQLNYFTYLDYHLHITYEEDGQLYHYFDNFYEDRSLSEEPSYEISYEVTSNVVKTQLLVDEAAHKEAKLYVAAARKLANAPTFELPAEPITIVKPANSNIDITGYYAAKLGQSAEQEDFNYVAKFVAYFKSYQYPKYGSIVDGVAYTNILHSEQMAVTFNQPTSLQLGNHTLPLATNAKLFPDSHTVHFEDDEQNIWATTAYVRDNYYGTQKFAYEIDSIYTLEINRNNNEMLASSFFTQGLIEGQAYLKNSNLMAKLIKPANFSFELYEVQEVKGTDGSTFDDMIYIGDVDVQQETPYFDVNIDTTALKTGKYYLYSNATVQGHYYNDWYDQFDHVQHESFKGTVLTFEGLDGENLRDGELSIYDLTNNMNLVYTSMNYQDGEYFIPYNNLKDDYEYIIIYQDDTTNIFYTKSFKGRDIKEIHLTKDKLAPLNLKTGAIKTNDFEVIISNRRVGDFQVTSITSDYMTSIEDTIQLKVSGFDDADAYYSYQQTYKDFNIDEKTKWASYYAKDLHKDGKFLIGEKENVPAIRYGGKAHEVTESVYLHVGKHDFYVVMDEFLKLENVKGIPPFKMDVSYYNETFHFMEIHPFLYSVTDGDDWIDYKFTDSKGNKKTFRSDFNYYAAAEGFLNVGEWYDVEIKGYSLPKDLYDIQLHTNVILAEGQEDEEVITPNTLPKEYEIVDYEQYFYNYDGVYEYIDFAFFEIFDLYTNESVASYYTYNTVAFAYEGRKQIDPSATYKTRLLVEIVEGKSLEIFKEYTGQELLQMKQLKIPSNLQHFKLDIEDERVLFTLSTNGIKLDAIDYRYSSSLYVSPGTYTIDAVKLANHQIKYYPTQNVTVNKYTKDIQLVDGKYNEIQFRNEGQVLPLSSISLNNSYEVFELDSYDVNTDTILVPKSGFNGKVIGVEKKIAYETPTYYDLDISNFDFSKSGFIDVDLQVDRGTMDVVYNGVDYMDKGIEFNYRLASSKAKMLLIQNSGLYADHYEYGHYDDGSLLPGGKYALRKLEGHYFPAYYSEVKVTITNEQKEVVYEGYSNEAYGYGSIQLNEELAPGKYTLTASIPVSQHDFYEVKSPFTVKVDKGPFIEITTPVTNSTVKENRIVVSGKADDYAFVQVQLRNKTTKETIQTKTVYASNDKFQVTFKDVANGEYEIVAINENATATLKVSVNVVEEEEAEIIVDKVLGLGDVDRLLKNPSVTYSTTLSNKEPFRVMIESDVSQAFIKNNKSLTIGIEDVKIKIPVEVFKQHDSEPLILEVGLSTAKLPSTNFKKRSNAYSFALLVRNTPLTAFDAPVEVTIPLLSTPSNTKKVAAYYINVAQNRVEYKISHVDGQQAVFKTLHFADFIAFEGNKTFTDTAKHWGKETIENLASVEIISGKSATEFKPDATITRAEFAALVTRALGLQKPAYSAKFKDVPNGQWFTADVLAAANAGIIAGYEDGTFKPNANVTREQMASMVVRALNYVNPDVTQNLGAGLTFEDSSLIASYAKDSVRIATSLKIISGYEANGTRTFKPRNNATRAEAAIMLSKMLENL